jgi:exosome complex component MTR3
MRPIALRLNHAPAASGSAYLELGATKVAAAVYGPRENTRAAGESVAQQGVLEVHAQFAPFASRRLRGLAPSVVMEEERRLAGALRAALLPAVLLERFPRCVVEVHLLVLEADGGELAAGALAASAALLHAGVDLADVVTAAQVGLRGGGGGGGGEGATSIVLDPCAAEEAACAGRATVAFMPALKRVTHAAHSGAVGEAPLLEALRAALGACEAVAGAMRPALLAAAKSRA